MSVYTAYMLALLAFTVGLHGMARDWVTVGLISLAAVPFLAVPGLSDTPYLSIERNSPIIGGFLAMVVGAMIVAGATQPWHNLISVLLGFVLIIGGLRLMGAISTGFQAIALELVFVAIMLLGTTARFVDINGGLPPPETVRKVTGIWARNG